MTNGSRLLASGVAVAVLCCTTAADSVAAKDVKPLPIGAACPSFELPGVDDRTWSREDFRASRLLVVIFTCNHCPTAQAYEERIMKLHSDYRDRGVALVAISPNDPKAVRLDELGYSDIGDSFDDMKLHAERRGFTFPYLYDGETQEVSEAFGVLATPHVFIFDEDRRLRYNGRIDDDELGPPTCRDARNAIEALLAGKPVPVTTTRVFGCSTKWSDKRDAAADALQKWNAEPVSLESATAEELQTLVANDTENYRLINLWSITCIPCIAEQPELVTINRMYRRRHFELITITTDPLEHRDTALKFLKQNHVSCRNLIFAEGSRDDLAEIVDAEWRGPLPYTILIAPGGDIIRRWNGEIDPQEVKTTLSNLLGRTYASRKD